MIPNDEFYYNAYLGGCLRKVPLTGHIMPTTVRLRTTSHSITNLCHRGGV